MIILNHRSFFIPTKNVMKRIALPQITEGFLKKMKGSNLNIKLLIRNLQFEIESDGFKLLESLKAIPAIMNCPALSWSEWCLKDCTFASAEWTFNIRQHFDLN